MMCAVVCLDAVMVTRTLVSPTTFCRMDVDACTL